MKSAKVSKLVFPVFGLSLLTIGLLFNFAPGHALAACGDINYPGTSWLTAHGNGVPSRSNGADEGATSGASCGVMNLYSATGNAANGHVAQDGDGWQCAELAELFYATEGWKAWGGWGLVNGAADIYNTATSLGFTRTADGSINNITDIEPGDMLVTHEETYGHVFIVDTVNSTANTISVVDQNGKDGGHNTVNYNPTTKKLSQGDGKYFVFSGVVHSPSNTFTNGGGSGPSDISTSSTGLVQKQDTGFTQEFVQGPNNSLLEYVDTPGNAWSAQIVVAGNNTTYSKPTAVVDQSTGFTQVFAEGPNNSLVNYWDTPGHPWSAGVAAGNNTTYSAPNAVYVQSTQEVEVFAEGASNSLAFNWNFPGGGWYAQTINGNNTTYSAPATVYSVEHGGLTQVFAEGASNSLFNMWDVSGSPWTGNLGTVDGSSTTYSQPAATYNGSEDNTQVFNEGPSNSLNTHWNTPGFSWYTQSAIDGTGTTYSAPSAVYSSNNGGITQIFNQGPSNSINSHWDSYGSAWSNGTVAGSNTLYADPDSVAIWSTGETQVLAQSASHGLSGYWDAYASPWGGPDNSFGTGVDYDSP